MKSKNEAKQIGLIADECFEVFPGVVKSGAAISDYKDKDGNILIAEGEEIKSIQYSLFVPMLIKAFQELYEEFSKLKIKNS